MKELTPEQVQAALAALGVQAKDPAAYAASLATLMKGAAPGFAALPFEAEPALFALAQRRNAP